MQIKEGSLLFDFNDDVTAIKFDEQPFYRNKFNVLKGARGVDILAYNRECFMILEVKDFRGYEIENRKRVTATSSVSKGKGCTEEPLDLELALKVRETLACMLAAALDDNEEDISPFFKPIIDKARGRSNISLKVLLFVEGDIPRFPLYSRNMIDSIKKKMRWLNARVFVENIDTHKAQHFFEPSRVKQN
jgi:hypothetical protein